MALNGLAKHAEKFDFEDALRRMNWDTEKFEKELEIYAKTQSPRAQERIRKAYNKYMADCGWPMELVVDDEDECDAIKTVSVPKLRAIPAMGLIAGGETNKVEFKSSFLWDYQRKTYNNEVKIAVMRAMSSFMNSEGGFLIIGIDDDKNPVGIDMDLAHVHNNSDIWNQTLTNAINTYLGMGNGVFFRIRWEKVEAKDIVVLDIKKSPHPVYLKHENRKEEFCIRSNNTTLCLSISDANQYIQEHWKDRSARKVKS